MTDGLFGKFFIITQTQDKVGATVRPKACRFYNKGGGGWYKHVSDIPY